MIAEKNPASDRDWMKRALQLAELGRGRTHPNPMVGAVVVKNGKRVGEGYHPESGQPHAEVFALRQAGEQARGATLYVTLEPCCHYGKTPPCVPAILASGVKRVVVAMADPYEAVAGRGLEQLRRAGVQVESGLCEKEARILNKAFLTYVTLKRPYITWKYAMTLDGRIASATGDSYWITGEAARVRVHELRNQVQAVITGVGTVLADDPQLTTRLPLGHPDMDRPIRHPIRIVLDSQARTPPEAKICQPETPGETWIVVAESADAERRRRLEETGVRLIELPVETKAGSRHVSLSALMSYLAEQQLVHALLECGSRLAGAFFDAGLIDEVYSFQASKFIGGERAPGPLGGRGISLMADARRLRSWDVEKIGEDLLIKGDLNVHWAG